MSNKLSEFKQVLDTAESLGMKVSVVPASQIALETICISKEEKSLYESQDIECVKSFLIGWSAAISYMEEQELLTNWR